LDKNFYTRIHCKSKCCFESTFENECSKTIKLPLFLLIEPNGILWILVCKLVRKPFPFTTISEDDYEYILNHSGAIYCFVSDAEILRKINLIRDKIPNVKEVYSFNEIEAVKTGTTY
jgi:hypothetical protein